MKDALELHDNDALWLVLIVLQHYETIYQAIPSAIAQQALAILEKHKDCLAQTAATAEAETRQQLAQAVAKAAQEVATNTSRKQMWQWAGGCLTTSFLCLGLFGWYMHTSSYDAGFNSGYGTGYSKAQEEKAASAWANTAEGQMAYKFAQFGELQRLAKCSGKGWKVDKGICYPYPNADMRTYGWALPLP